MMFDYIIRSIDGSLLAILVKNADFHDRDIM
jgi:hypothetical protein